MSTPEFDLETLEQLIPFDVDGKPLIEVLCQDFSASAPKLLQDIRAAYAAGALENASQGAHALKSAARTLGLAGVGDLCQAIEDQPALDPAAAARLSQLESAFARGMAWLEERRRNLKPA